MFLDGKIFDDFLTTYLFYSVILNYFPISKNLNITLITKYLQNYQKDTNITSNQHNVLILDTAIAEVVDFSAASVFFILRTQRITHTTPPDAADGRLLLDGFQILGAVPCLRIEIVYRSGSAFLRCCCDVE